MGERSELLAAGWRVRAMTRHPDSDAANDLAGRGAEVVQADLDDEASLERALKGDYSKDARQRDLQLEAKAHIAVQEWIDGGALQGNAVSTNAIREIHRRFCELLPEDLLWVEDPTTKEKLKVIPGELRQRHVAVGRHIPVSAPAVPRFLKRFEEVYGNLGKTETILAAAAAHHRLTWIHPFLDGNGRVGRLLITFLLCQQAILHQPLLYLSHYLKAHRAEYYDRLTAIRTEGNWEGWLKFFLRGVFQVSQAATTTARAILDLREAHRLAITQKAGGSANGLILLDYLFEQPMTMVRLVERQLHCAYATAGKLVDQLVDLGLLRETTGGQRNRVFRYEPYLALFEPPSLLEAAEAPDSVAVETTGAHELPA